jgi:predicted dinucleotide-binding enzyme
MKICVFGAGAVGGHIAARLAAQGHDVSVVARGAHLAAIEKGGLKLRHGDELIQGKVRTTNLGKQDLVIVALKANLLDTFADAAAPLLGPETAVVFAQNGIPWWYGMNAQAPDLSSLDPQKKLAKAIDPKRVIGAYLTAVEATEEQLLAATTARAVQEAAEPAALPETPAQSDPTGSDMFTATEGRWGSREAEIVRVALLDTNDQPSFVFHTGDAMSIRLHVRALHPIDDFVFGIGLFNADGVCCYGTNTYIEEMNPQRLAGDADVTFAVDNLASYISQIESGAMRALAVTSAQREPSLPDVPTVAETVPGYEATAWFGIGMPKGTPKEIIEKVNAEVNRALADPAMRAKLAELGGRPIAGTPEDFGKVIAAETAKWEKVVISSGAKVE